jgi:hypothetical protein
LKPGSFAQNFESQKNSWNSRCGIFSETGLQAQIPAFLAEAHADAEAQAQVQVPQVQVGEVSDVNSNVNSANSPVVVSSLVLLWPI